MTNKSSPHPVGSFLQTMAHFPNLLADTRSADSPRPRAHFYSGQHRPTSPPHPPATAATLEALPLHHDRSRSGFFISPHDHHGPPPPATATTNDQAKWLLFFMYGLSSWSDGYGNDEYSSEKKLALNYLNWNINIFEIIQYSL